MGSFDVALLDSLLSAGVSHDRARAVVDLFDKSIDERYGLHAQVLATKRDLADVEARLSKDIAALETRATAEIARTQVQIAETRAQISATKADLIKWTLAALATQTALLLGAMRLL